MVLMAFTDPCSLPAEMERQSCDKNILLKIPKACFLGRIVSTPPLKKKKNKTLAYLSPVKIKNQKNERLRIRMKTKRICM